MEQAKSLTAPIPASLHARVTEERIAANDAPEFECRNVRDMVKYVNTIAPELAQGIQPPFVKEKEAVGAYVRQHEVKDAYCVRREGAHRFTYLSSCDWKYRPIAVSTTLEDIPEGFDAGQAEKHGGLYVFWSEAPALDKADHAVQQSQRRKEQER